MNKSKILLTLSTLLCFYMFSDFHGLRRNFKKSVNAATSSESDFVVIENQKNDKYPYISVPHLYDRQVPLKKVECRVGTSYRIPNVIHYVWFGKWNIQKLHYLSIRSAALIQRPDKVVLHLDKAPPVGIYWNKLKDEIPCLEIVEAIKPKYIYGRKIRDIEHKSDAERMRILLEEGGIYADVNLLFVQPLDRLMNKSFVIGKEDDRTYGNSLLLAEPRAPFMEVWFRTYFTFDYRKWAEHSTQMPKRLHEAFPELPIHVEDYSIMRPNYDDAFAWLSEANWDLRHNYCVHIYVHDEYMSQWLPDVLNLPFSQLVTFDNTFGQLIRLALFGTPYLSLDKVDKIVYESHTPMSCGPATKLNNIPNEVHYIWNGGKMMLQNYLSIKSVVKNLSPNKVYFHLLKDADPLHYRYLQLWREIPCFSLINSTDIMHQSKRYHQDENIQLLVARLLILKAHGGISPSNDTFLNKNLNDIMNYKATIDSDKELETNLIISQQNSSFITAWLEKIKNLNYIGRETNSSDYSAPNAGAKKVQHLINKFPYPTNKDTESYGYSFRNISLLDYTSEKRLLLDEANEFYSITAKVLL